MSLVCAWSANADFNRWTNRVEIIFDGYAGASPLVNFPALIKLSFDNPVGFDYSLLQPDGSDLRFADASDGAELPYEIERWDTSGESYVWVRIPTLTASSAITMHLSNPNAGPSELAGSAFPSEFGYVWHMNAPVISNAVAAYPYTLSSTKPQSPVVTNDAPSGAALRWFGLMDRPLKSTAALTAFSSGDSPFTTSHWLRRESNSGSHIFRTLGGSGNALLILYTYDWAYRTGLWNPEYKIPNAVPLKEWTHYATVYHPGVGAITYVNGVERGVRQHTSLNINWNVGITFGELLYDQLDLDGILDEFRLSPVARSADWVKAEYDAMSGGAFYTIGEVESSEVVETPVLTMEPLPISVTPTAATMTGELLSSDGGAANLLFVWGTTNPATTATNAWQNVLQLSAIQPLGAFTNTLSGLIANTAYFYRIGAVNADGIGWASGTGVFMTGALTANSTPANELRLEPGTFTISRPPNTTAIPMTVPYTISAASTATLGADYTISPIGSITFNPGATSTTVSIAPILDLIAEGDETVILEFGEGPYVMDIPLVVTNHIIDLVFPGGGTNVYISTRNASPMNNPADWSLGHLPLPDEVVLIDRNYGMTVPSGTQLHWSSDMSHTIAGLIIEENVGSVFSPLVTYPGAGSFTNFTVTGDVILNKAHIQHQANAASKQHHRINLTIGGTLYVNTGSAISASFRGYPRYDTHIAQLSDRTAVGGPGAGLGLAAGDWQGGGYGGLGAPSLNIPNRGPTSKTYGSIFAPDSLGAGAYSTTLYSAQGGGAIYIDARGGIMLTGIIENDSGRSPEANGGNGSGGSILIKTPWIKGAGAITASALGGNLGAGGGGGRIAIHLTSDTGLDEYTGSIRAFGSNSSTALYDGAAGTIYIQNSDQDDQSGAIYIRNFAGAFSSFTDYALEGGPVMTQLPPTFSGQFFDGPDDNFPPPENYRAAALILQENGRLSVTDNIRVKSLEMTHATACLHLCDGATLNTESMTVLGEKIPAGTYHAAQLTTLTGQDITGAGTVNIIGASTLMIVR